MRRPLTVIGFSRLQWAAWLDEHNVDRDDVHQSAVFVEDEMSDPPQIDYAALADEISGWLRHHVDEAGAARLVLGLSGGIDSAVVCALSTMALGPSRVIGAILPIASRREDRQDAELVARTFEITTHLIDLEPAFAAMVAAMPEGSEAGLEDANVDNSSRSLRRQLALANVKPRLRMTALYYLANRYNGLVVGTGNKTELSIGYFTKYGDGGVDLLPLGDLDKTTVRALARELGIPDRVIAKSPSAGLWEGQTDEAEIGISYDELDEAIKAIGEAQTDRIAPVTLERVKRLIVASDHKRRSAPMFRRDVRDVLSAH